MLAFGALAVILGLGAWYWFASPPLSPGGAGAGSSLRLGDIPFNGRRAYEYLKQLCRIGPRPSGSPGMATQQKLLAETRATGGRCPWPT